MAQADSATSQEEESQDEKANKEDKQEQNENDEQKGTILIYWCQYFASLLMLIQNIFKSLHFSEEKMLGM